MLLKKQTKKKLFHSSVPLRTIRISVFVSLLFYSKSYAITQGPYNGTTFTNNVSIGTIAWTTLPNAQTSNNIYADVFLNYPPSQISNYLVTTNFGFAIPAGSIIDGITVDIEGSVDFATNSNIYDQSIRIVKGGVIVGTDQAGLCGACFPVYWNLGSDVVRTYGGCTNLWGETWTAADINANTFGVAFSAISAGSISGNVLHIDHIRITICYSVTLPIELISFEANCIGNNLVSVEWSSASETNNDYFTIERSRNGNSFEVIAIIDGAGTSSTTQYYNWTCESSLTGINYYRLKQTDFNGQFEYFNSIAVENSCIDTPAELTIFPNPVADDIGIQFFSSNNETVIIEVYDVVGKLIASISSAVLEGDNLFTLNIPAIASGIYMLNVKTKSKFISKKFIKQ